ncbi:MAG TPA: cell division protein FtsQ/DivIB [Gaiellaceae bacterium]|nr:cell division protein FtsQ/DivIB [Gaiellaceae bacterium]
MPATRKRSAARSGQPLLPALLVRMLPPGRWLLVGFGLLALAAGGYFGARQSSLFAIKRVEATGARPAVVRRVDRALAPLAGESLLSVDVEAVDRRLAALPDVRLVAYDRAFPHTARIVVAAERPVAVLRSGSKAWLVSERGRVLRRLVDESRSTLPRIWVAGAEVPADGGLLSEEEALLPALALGQVLTADARFLGSVRAARAQDGQLVLVLRTGTEIRLGMLEDMAVKLSVARRIMRLLAPGARYVDVSLPERPVALE